ncbi:hypothetical protein UlMin_024957 [Ulmus minor]
MSVCVNPAGLPSSLSSLRLRNGYKFFYLSENGVSARFRSPKLTFLSLHQNQFRQFCSVNGNDIDASGLSEALSRSAEHEGSTGEYASGQGGFLNSNEKLKQLRRYGTAGLLSYGLLNTAYYLTTFLFVWFYVAPAPGKMGYLAAVERFVKIMGMVWAGSQITKLIRAGGALALAPFVDRGLSWFTAKFKFESQGKASMAIVAFCLGVAMLLFFVVTLLSV